jgi:hypothetical protein
LCVRRRGKTGGDRDESKQQAGEADIHRVSIQAAE